MKFLVATLLTAILAFVAGLMLPWWSIAIIAFLVALFMSQGAGRSFLSGFTAIFLLWFVLAAFISSKNDGILAGKIGVLLGIGNKPFLLYLVTGLVGGLVAGFAAWAGSYIPVFQKRN